jgi:hypothetical protein
LSAPARVAVLETGFTLDRSAREFVADDMEALREWMPEAIVAPLAVALSMADRKTGGALALESVSVAIVVLTTVNGPTLEESHRELLWKAFGVPVFEQLRDSEGAVVARECEVHDGLHVDEMRVARGLSALNASMANEIVSEPCECGSETPRLRGYRSTRLPNELGTWNVVAPVGRHATKILPGSAPSMRNNPRRNSSAA